MEKLKARSQSGVSLWGDNIEDFVCALLTESTWERRGQGPDWLRAMKSMAVDINSMSSMESKKLYGIATAYEGNAYLAFGVTSRLLLS